MKKPQPLASVKIERGALVALQAFCKESGLKQTWALSRAAEKFAEQAGRA